MMLMLSLIVQLLVSTGTAKFVGVDVTLGSDSAPTEYGCMPAQFSTSQPSFVSTQTTKIMNVIYCQDGCAESDFPVSVEGQTAIIRLVTDSSSTCSISSRIARAKQAGALGVILANHIVGEVPYPLSWDYTSLLPTVPDRTKSSSGIDMAVCLMSYANSMLILSDLAPSTGKTVDWSKFQRWDRANEPSTGTHTVLSVLSPMAIKDDWPAAQASFNPETWDAVSADVVLAQWSDDCLPTPLGESQYLSYYCDKCWRATTKFVNVDQIQNNILLYTRPYSICYPYFYDLALTGQTAGATGVVASLANNELPVYLAPHLIPYRMVAPLLAVQQSVGKFLTEATSADIRVQAIIHAISNGVGPSYFPPAEYHKSLPETDLSVQCSPVRGGTGSGGVVQHDVTK